MASVTLQVGDRFTPGLIVNAYLALGGRQVVMPPSNAVMASAAVAANGSLTLAGLADATSYYAAKSDGAGGYVLFSTPAAGAGGSGGAGGGVILPFQALHAYVAGEAMIQGGATYTRNSAGTSRATFDATELALWSLLPAGVASITRQALLNAGSALNEELVFLGTDGRTITVSDETVISAAPFPLAVRAGSLTVSTGGASADDVNYWTVQLGRWRSGTWATIASKTSQTTALGGDAIAGKIPWTFDSVTFDATNAAIVKDDVIGVKYVKTAAPTDLVRPRLVVRYEGV